MNLWVKRTGQLLLAALFLIACEDDSFLLGFRNQNKKFNVGYQEFLIGEGSVISTDSVLTDNLASTNQRLLIGEYTDPIVGSVRTEAFAEFLPVFATKLASSATLGYVYDSLVLQMRLDYYSYGLVNEGISNFKIHRITEDTLSYRKTVTSKIKNKNGVLVDSTRSVYGASRYYANSTIGYNEAEYLGESRLVKLSTIKGKEKYTNTTLKLSKLEAGKDTLLAIARLDDLFGQELFNVAKDDVDKEFSDNKKFRSRFKGLALIPSESYSVIGYNRNDGYSRVVLYYHTTENGINKDTLSRIFYSNVSFHSITPNRTAELPSPDPAFVGTVPASGLRVIQSGNPLLTKIDLSSFYSEFADTVKNKIIINSAELLIQSVVSEDGYKPISSLEVNIMKENDKYMDYRIEDDSTQMSGYYVYTNGQNYFAINDVLSSPTPVPAFLYYSSSKNSYSGFVTLFVQNLLDDVLKDKDRVTPKPADNRLRYLGLYPTGEVGKSINRSVFNKSNIKLRIYYTYPNKTNL